MADGRVHKLVVVGAGACGKTSVLDAANGGVVNGERYAPTVMDDMMLDIRLQDGTVVVLHAWDTAGQEDYARLRPLSYPNTHIVLICFSVSNPDSFASVTRVQDSWAAEVRHFCPDVPYILVGCKIDLRHDPATIRELRETNEHPVTTAEGEATAAQIGALAYIECSAYTAEGVNDVFETAARAVLAGNRRRRRRVCVLM